MCGYKSAKRINRQEDRKASKGQLCIAVHVKVSGGHFKFQSWDNIIIRISVDGCKPHKNEKGSVLLISLFLSFTHTHTDTHIFVKKNRKV